MATVGEYLQTWKLKLGTKKAVLAVFHLNNKETKRALKVNHNNETMPFFSEPTSLGATLDRILTHPRQFESLRKKLTSRVALLRRLAGSSWDAAATTLRTATLSLVHSTAGYCAPVWCRIAHTHLLDPATNDASLTVIGCLRLQCVDSTPTDNLLILAGIQLSERRRKGATLSLARRSTEPGHLGGNARHLKSRHPFVPAAQQLISSSDDNNGNAALWADHRWNAERLESTTKLRTFIPYPLPWNSPAKNSVSPAQQSRHQCQTFPLLAQMGYGSFCGS